MITLYDNAMSPFAQKVKMVLHEKGIAFKRVTPDLASPEKDFLDVSPLREVPALVDGDVSLFESTIITEYLEEQYPQIALMPRKPVDRARVRLLQSICDSQLEAIIFGMTEFIAFKRADGEVAASMLGKAKADIKHLLGWLESQLGTRAFFNGDAFGMGDIAVLPYMSTLALYKLGPAEGSALDHWFKKAKAQPSFQRCIEDSKAEVGTFKESVARVYSGLWPRQYRNHRIDWFLRCGGFDIVADGYAKSTIRFSQLPFYNH
jgi:glutathione S-transferase/RNA polymerase-associated protein